MDTKEEDALIKKYTALATASSQYARPSIAADIVAMGARTVPTEDERRQDTFQMRLLLIRRGQDPFKGQWALPGGFFQPKDVDVEACARRECKEEAHLVIAPNALIPFGVFSRKGRDPRGWYISMPYIASVISEDDMLHIKGGDDAAEARWFTVGYTREGERMKVSLTSDDGERIAFKAICRDNNNGFGQPEVKATYEDKSLVLGFDHEEIIAVALHALGMPGRRQRALTFMRDAFTLAQLRFVYDFMDGKDYVVNNPVGALERRTAKDRSQPIIPQRFRRIMLPFLEEAGMETGVQHRPAMLYRWNGKPVE